MIGMVTQENVPLFTVVIPLYNKADTIERTLRSVQSQVCRDFEVVIVDDGSTDDGVVVAERFKGELRLKVVRQNNAGVSVARNTGAQHAQAPYLAFLDADDEWLPGYLEEIKRMIEEFPDVEVYGTNYYCVTSKSLICNRSWVKARKLVDFNNAWIRRCPIHTSSSVIKKDAFIAVGGFVPNHKYYEDAELLFKLSPRGKFCVSSIPLLRYNTDAAIRATGAGKPISLYAHWIYFENVLSAGEHILKINKVVKWDLSRQFVENFIHGNIAASKEVCDTYPCMVKSMGWIGGLLLRHNDPIAWIVAIIAKGYFVILSRLAVKRFAT